MVRRLVANDPEKCNGCRICEFACSSKKEKAFNPVLSRIRYVQLGVVSNTTLTCRFCESPTCVKSCPRKALSNDEQTGVILVEENKCSGCGWCIEACEFGALVLHPVSKKIVVCDQCDGEPACVKCCPKKALELRTAEEISQKMRKAAAKKLLEEG